MAVGVHVMAGTVGRRLFHVLLNANICKQPGGLHAIGSKLGHRLESTYKAAVLQEFKKALVIKEQNRQKLRKDEVSKLGYNIINMEIEDSGFIIWPVKNYCIRCRLVVCLWLVLVWELIVYLLFLLPKLHHAGLIVIYSMGFTYTLTSYFPSLFCFFSLFLVLLHLCISVRSY